MVLIFGKDGCPYTQAARDHYESQKAPYKFVNVTNKPADVQGMLEYSKGARRVPVIVDGGKVTVGFGGT
jgi:glutaredoxin 3